MAELPLSKKLSSLVFFFSPRRRVYFHGTHPCGEQQQHSIPNKLLAPFCFFCFPSTGQSRCLDAFIVALGQVCEGGLKQWYASTLELQLASLEFCRACRGTRVLAVRVNDRTSRSLWFSPTSETRRTTRRAKKLCFSTRVPGVRARCLEWALPMDDLVRSTKVELWRWSEVLLLRGLVSARSLKSVTWPAALRKLVLGVDLEVYVWAAPWPRTLEHLVFGNHFNKPIDGVV